MSAWWRIATVVAVLGGACLASAAHGVPDHLPAGSLGWPLLLHVERAAAVLGLLATVLLVGLRAVNGQLPVRVGHIEYPMSDVDARTKTALAGQDARLRIVENVLQLDQEHTADAADPVDTL